MKISNPLFRLLATNCALGTALGAAMVIGLWRSTPPASGP